KSWMWSTIAVCDDGLNVLQFPKARFGFIEIERRQRGVDTRADAEIILQEQHVRNFTHMAHIVGLQPGRVVGRPECEITEPDRFGCLQERKDRNGAWRFASAIVMTASFVIVGCEPLVVHSTLMVRWAVDNRRTQIVSK